MGGIRIIPLQKIPSFLLQRDDLIVEEILKPTLCFTNLFVSSFITQNTPFPCYFIEFHLCLLKYLYPTCSNWVMGEAVNEINMGKLI